MQMIFFTLEIQHDIDDMLESFRSNKIAEDVFVNVVGGMIIDEFAVDMGVVVVVVSSVRNRSIKSLIAVFGEVGLVGEVRGIS